MKLLELRVRDFRSLVDVRLPLRNLTVMIGPNGAGKTALLETDPIAPTRQPASAWRFCR